MIDLLKKIFIDNWVRKIISFFVAIILWFILNDSFSKSRDYTTLNTEITEEVR